MPGHVLILGGHGKVAQHLTRVILSRSWTVTSVIRSQEQVAAIEKSAAATPGRVNILVQSLEQIKDVSQAKKILDQVKPDAVVWSAGAGGKGDKERVSGKAPTIRKP